MKRRLALFGTALLCALSLSADNSDKIREMRDRAKAAIEADSVSLERHILPLVDMLRKAKNEDDQRKLIDALAGIGRYDGSSPSPVKRIIVEQTTPILLAIAENKSNSSFLRGDAIHALRDIGAPRAALEEVTRMALADSDGFVQSRGVILENYLASLPAGSTGETTQPADPEEERKAIAFLRSRQIGVSTDQLSRSAMEAKADEVKALLAAGVPVEGAGSDSPLIDALRSCSTNGETAELLETIDVLLAAGADLKRTDDNRNTPLMTAAQFCGEQVIARLMDAGADANVVNGSGITPLMMAIYSSRMEAAEALVAKGARLTEQQVTMVSAMPDPRVKALAEKAKVKTGGTSKKKK